MKMVKLELIIVMLIMMFLGCSSKEKAAQKKFFQLQQEANMAMAEKNFKLAEQKYLESIKIDPKPQFARNNLAVLYARFMNRPEDAKLLWEGLLEETPNNSAYLNNLAGIYRVQKKYDKAIEMYERAKKNSNTYHMPYYNIGIMYIQQGKYKEAAEELLKGQKLVPKDSSMIAVLAKAQFLSGDREAAEGTLQRQLSLKPDDYWVGIVQEQILRRLKDYEKLEELISVHQNNEYFIAEDIEIMIDQQKPADEILEKLTNSTSNFVEFAGWFPKLVNAQIQFLNGKEDECYSELMALDGAVNAGWLYYEGIRQNLLAEIYNNRGESEKYNQAMEVAILNAPILFAPLEIEDEGETEGDEK